MMLIGDESFDETATIMAANSKLDLISEFDLSSLLSTSSGNVCKIEFKNIAQVNGQEKEEMFLIFEESMKALYESTWGWDKDAKIKEIFSTNAKFLIVRSERTEEAEGIIVGWAMFKFEWDDLDEPEHPVCFCYEIHVHSSYRSHSIGGQLIRMIMEISSKLGMWKTMLSCFKINTKAISFYKKSGFDIDVNSPSRCGFPDECHEIFSDKPSLR